jgi:hypothetical protein
MKGEQMPTLDTASAEGLVICFVLKMEKGDAELG